MVKCPDCEATAKNHAGLSAHRRSAHGYVSTRNDNRRKPNRKYNKRTTPAEPPKTKFTAHPAKRAGLSLTLRQTGMMVLEAEDGSLWLAEKVRD